MSTFEKIDSAREKKGQSSFEGLIESVIQYCRGEVEDIKERLRIERALSKYANSNTPDWLLNLLLRIYADCNEQNKASRPNTSKDKEGTP